MKPVPRSFLFALVMFLYVDVCWSVLPQPLKMSAAESVDFVKENCGYDLEKFVGDDLVSANIYPLDGNYFSYEFDVKLKVNLSSRLVDAVFTASCSGVNYSGHQWSSLSLNNELSIKEAMTLSRPSSPRDIIAEEDSGGRYSRLVNWTRSFYGNNFKGKISYVNSVFGDGVVLSSPDYFLICPESVRLSCMSLQFSEKVKLSHKERHIVLVRLREIKYNPSHLQN